MILSFLALFFKYSLLYIYLYLCGSSLFLFINYVRKKDSYETHILYTKVNYLYPLLGVIFVGNILFIFNTFFALGSFFINILLLSLTIPSLLKILANLKIRNFQKSKSFFNIAIYFVIPALLIISTFDINFNYDAGYYHLLHQNWLRESNLIIGFVNIFWPLGMSSIYEYISAVLWFDTSFVLLHFLNLYFIHFFYIFISDNLVNSKRRDLTNISIFILIYSLLDNFGIGGGRNGYLYIQGVGKQDVTVGVLFFFLAVVMLLKLKDRNITSLEIIILSFVTFFIYQIKVSGVLIAYIYAFLILSLLRYKIFKIKKLFLLHSPILIFGFFWLLKSVYTTGCLIYPVNFTCYEGFSWYVKNSTIEFEGITTSASLAFDNSIPFMEWARITGAFEYRTQVLTNFLASLIFLIILKRIFFKKQKVSLEIGLLAFSFIIFNFIYLIFFGPIPRYAVGLGLVTIGTLGFYSGELKFKLNNLMKYTLIFISVFLLVRSTAYLAWINNDDLRLFDPRTSYEINTEIGFRQYSENWVEPLEGDQCWANTQCTNAEVDIIFEKYSIFKVAYK